MENINDRDIKMLTKEQYEALKKLILSENARKAGSVRSEKKAKASRENGKKGGRPKKNLTKTKN